MHSELSPEFLVAAEFPCEVRPIGTGDSWQGARVMSLAELTSQWCIYIVVTPQNLSGVTKTLASVRDNSLASDITVLACASASGSSALADIDYPVEYVVPEEIAAGSYWITILSRVQLTDYPALFLLAGCLVPECWDARLIAAGQRANQAVAVAPLCARHSILSAFGVSIRQRDLGVDEIDQWLNDYAAGVEFTVPLMLESCMLLQGKGWRGRLASAKNDQDLLNHIRLSGDWLLATDQVYVDDSDVVYSTDVAAIPEAVLNAYQRRHPLTAVRHALSELADRAERPPILKHCLPVELHVGHSWGGGLGRWIENYIEADPAHNHLVLRSIGDRSAFGQQIALYSGASMGVPIRTWVLAEPIRSTVISQYEYALLLQEIMTDFAIESIVVSSLIGHSMDLLRTGLPTTYVAHDFFPFCPALYACYGGPCSSCTSVELGACTQSNPLATYFRMESVEHWVSARAAFLDFIAADEITMVVPSRSVLQRYSVLAQQVSRKDVRIVEHGLSADLAQRLYSVRGRIAPDNTNRLRIVLLGRITPEKGAALLDSMMEAVTRVADLWLLGAGENGRRFVQCRGVTVVEEFAMSELHEHLAAISPHMGLLVSIVPETFSYTLSELWAAGIPVLATRLGAFSDRIVDGKNGWLEELNAQSIVDRVEDIDHNRDELQFVKQTVLDQHVRTSADMVLEYARLKPQLEFIPMQRYFLPRRTFKNPYTKVRQGGSALLHIDHQSTYRNVFREFLYYTLGKVEQTPRLPRVVKHTISSCLSFAIRLISTKKIKE